MDRQKSLSFEYFPPKTEAGIDKLLQCAKELQQLQPHFCSVTFGAGGALQTNTQIAVKRLLSAGINNLVPHLSCVSTTDVMLRDMINQYVSLGLNRFVVLRGDLPTSDAKSLMQWSHASDLVSFIRQEWGDQLHLSVAAYPEAHPESDNLNTGMQFFLAKMHAGADDAITQYFYNAESYRRLLARCRKAGMNKPIIPGVMPLDNYAGIQRFSARCGADIPRWLEKEMCAYANDEQGAFEVGVEIVSALCMRLLDLGAPSLHFYTLNRSRAVMAILQQLQQQGYLSLDSRHACVM
jgi:methylenetetrahydrofolate reductase (NADPH)